MISDGTLFEIAEHLRRSKDNVEMLTDLRNIIEDIYNLESYQNWLQDGQFHSIASTSSRFQIPDYFGRHYSDAQKSLLETYSLISGNQLAVKIEKHGNDIHLTDGSWVSSHKRVFPFTDESRLLAQWAQSNFNLDKVDLLIDPACGCGHHAMAFPKETMKFCTDVNARALAYGTINSILANDINRYFSHFDINDGIHPIANRIQAVQTLILINMPFAIFPQKEGVKKHHAQDGGTHGFELTKAAVKSSVEFFRKSNSDKLNAAILCYTMGNPAIGRWEVLDYFDGLNSNFKRDFRLLDDEKLWRVNGKKEQNNPMPLSALKLKGQCYHSYSDRDFEWATEGYEKIESDLRSEGFTHLGYGILEISRNEN